MKIFTSLISLFLIFFVTNLYAQMEYFAEMNLNTGEFKTISKLPEVKFIGTNPSFLTFDEINQVYFFKGKDDKGKIRLYSIDAKTGNILNNPLFPATSKSLDNFIEFQYDNNTQTLYSLHWNNALQTEFLVSIDPATGYFSIIDSIPGVKLIKSCTIFDEKNHLFIFCGANASYIQRLYAVDVTNGKVVSSPQISDLWDLKFNNTTKKLIGLNWDKFQKKAFLVEVDREWGNFRTIDSIPGLLSFVSFPNFTIIDENYNHFIFKGSDKTGLYIYTIDIDSGKIVNKLPFPSLCNKGDNIIEFHHSKKANKVFALYWEAVTFKKSLRDTVVCANMPLKLNVPNFTRWSNGDYGQTITPKTNGYFYAEMRIGCDIYYDTMKIEFYPIHKPVLGLDVTICSDQTKFIMNTLGYQFISAIWNTGATDDSIFAKPGYSYILTVTDENKCITSDTIQVSSKLSPNFTLGHDTILCMGDSITFDLNDKGATYLWNDELTSPLRFIKKSGIYTLKAELDGCEKTDTIKIDFLTAKADFITNDVCENNPVIFINKSSPDSLNYKWKFGDGQITTSMSPMHLYNIGGISRTYNVTLVASAFYGCSDSVTMDVTINANPISDFNFTINQNKFDFKSIQSGLTSYKWYFGNGDSSSTKDIIYTYPKSGNFSVCLKTINASGCVSQTCKEVSITLGISEIFKQNAFKIYPNPNSGSFTIEKTENKEILTIEIFNQIGQIVYWTELMENLNTLDLNLPRGIYLIRATNKKYMLSQRMIVSN